MSSEPRSSLLQRAAELGRLAEEAQAAGNHRRAAELYRQALLLLQRQSPASDGSVSSLDSLQVDGVPAPRGMSGLFATAATPAHATGSRADGGDTSTR